MNATKEVAYRWIAVTTQHAKKDTAHFEKLATSTVSLETIRLAQTGAMVSTEILRRLENLQLALLCDADAAELVALVQSAGIAAIDDLVAAHADPVGAIDGSWTVEQHIKVTAAARVVQGSKWTLAEIEKATASNFTEDGSMAPPDNYSL